MINIDELKFDSNGLIPAIVVDAFSKKVLTLAYMNRESLLISMEKKCTCFYSRSRNKLWLKGETSGNFQHIVSITADCDKDTILAKVSQVGPACHTGSYSCFFNSIMEKEDAKVSNPLKVFEDVFAVIQDRKVNPKEGSYTNYLFDKGIDKILKKCGEEATEIVIAAKNPEKEEIKYEVADFLYHLMVLMVECNVDWNDIVRELAHRR